MSADLILGARIYRPVRRQANAAGEQLLVETPTMQYFEEDGTTMIRARPAAPLAPDWLAVNWEEPGGRVCVCDEIIPPDWTYFEVLFADVNFVAVSPVVGDPEELQRLALAG